jgi:hypothetical protein
MPQGKKDFPREDFFEEKGNKLPWSAQFPNVSQENTRGKLCLNQTSLYHWKTLKM